MENLNKTCASLNFMTVGFLPFHCPGRKRNSRPFGSTIACQCFSGTTVEAMLRRFTTFRGFPPEWPFDGLVVLFTNEQVPGLTTLNFLGWISPSGILINRGLPFYTTPEDVAG